MEWLGEADIGAGGLEIVQSLKRSTHAYYISGREIGFDVSAKFRSTHPGHFCVGNHNIIGIVPQELCSFDTVQRFIYFMACVIQLF